MFKYFVLFFSFVFVVSCKNAKDISYAEKGIIDFSSKKSDSLSLYPLSGDWLFFPDTIIEPSMISDASASLPYFFIKVPHKTRNLKGATSGTYVLTVKGIRSDEKFLLDIFTIYSASKVYVNGQNIGGNGVVGNSKSKSIPNWFFNAEPFSIGDNLQIVVQFSNFHKEKSGIINPIGLWTTQSYSRKLVWRMLFDFIILGCVLFIFIVQIVSFIGSRDKLALYLALTALSFFCYLFFLSIFHLKVIYDGIDLQYTFSLIFWRTSLALIVTFFTGYVHLLYPKLFLAKIKNAVAVYSLFTIAVNLFWTYSVGNFNAVLYRYVVLILALFIAYVAVTAAYRKYSYARIFLVGFAIFMLTAINDLLLNMDLINSINIAGAGVLGLMLVNLHLNNYRLNNALAKSRLLANELTELNSNLERIVEDRTKDLEKSRIEAESANKTKSVFLSSVSHEIRTPLNAIIGFSDLLKTTELDEEQSEFVTNVINAGLMLHDLINNVLDISKIEAGKLHLNEQKFNLQDLLKHVKNVFDLQIKDNNLQFIIDVEPDLIRTYIGDKLRLSQILMNLVGNALKFTEHGYVALSVKRNGFLPNNTAMLLFSVKDTGIGIRQENVSALFTPFSQIDNSATRRFKGTGLGLSISKQLVEMMGGEMSVKTEFGTGSDFYFTVSLKLIDDLVDIESNDPLNKERLAGKRFLIVDDNDLNTEMLKKIINNEKGHADKAWNGAEAIEALKRSVYDLILMDIEMPEMDGFEATRIIRDKMNLQTPIICLTAHALDNDKKRFIDAGMNDYLSKPIIRDDLIVAIEQLIGKR